jgi:hypothetical protein
MPLGDLAMPTQSLMANPVENQLVFLAANLVSSQQKNQATSRTMIPVDKPDGKPSGEPISVPSSKPCVEPTKESSD